MANVSSFSGAMPVIPGGLVELGYSQITSSVTVDNATAGTGKEVIAPMTVVCDGGPILVEFFSSSVNPNGTQNDTISISLFVDGAEQSRYWAYIQTPAAGFDYRPVQLQYRMSPSAGSHTFSVKAFVTAAARTGSISAGTGATSGPPAFLRVSKIVNQNDGLKPFWTPPVVTQLPSQATVGDQVIYAADATNGVYWTLYYDGIGTYPWKFVGGPALLNANGGQANTAANTNWQDVAEASVTIPLAGDYNVSWNGHAGIAATESAYIGVYANATNPTDGDAGAIYSTANIDAEVARAMKITVTTANTVMKTRVRMSVANARTFSRQSIIATPIRVKAA